MVSDILPWSICSSKAGGADSSGLLQPDVNSDGSGRVSGDQATGPCFCCLQVYNRMILLVWYGIV